MSKVALVVDLKLVPGRLDDFVARANRHSETCLAQEEGCLRFDILVSQESADQVFLYEVYADQAAVDTHVATAHMAQYREDTKDMIAERTRHLCQLVNQ